MITNSVTKTSQKNFMTGFRPTGLYQLPQSEGTSRALGLASGSPEELVYGLASAVISVGIKCASVF
jgi:hypothetical protein